MGTRSNLYAGQPGATATTLVTSAASTVTTITYAHAKNTGTDVETLSVTMSGVVVADNLVLNPGEDIEVFAILGGTLNAAQTLTMTASTAATINVKVDGYEISTA